MSTSSTEPLTGMSVRSDHPRSPHWLVEIDRHYVRVEDVQYRSTFYDRVTGAQIMMRALIDIDWRTANNQWVNRNIYGDSEYLEMRRFENFYEWINYRSLTAVGPDDFFSCNRCSALSPDDMANETAEDGDVCRNCFSSNYIRCHGCDGAYAGNHVHYVGGSYHCTQCRDESYFHCEHCGSWYGNYRRDEHRHGLNNCCVSPALEFEFPNNGSGVLAQDQRFGVTLAEGQISQEGVAAIAAYIVEFARTEYSNARHDPDRTHESIAVAMDRRGQWYNLSQNLHQIGEQWQKRDGNYPKRLSRFAYKQYALKVPPAVLTAIGNIGSDHSRAISFNIEVTRDFEQSAALFGNAGSCWWQSYASSRCALKSNGGIGLRTFDEYGNVTGRTWIMPLTYSTGGNGRRRKDKRFTSTFESVKPDAYMVFNGYGTLQGYTGARLVSYLTGLTYRKIALTDDIMYINSGSGYLVAPEAVAELYTDESIHLTSEQHSIRWEDEAPKRLAATAAAAGVAVSSLGDVVSEVTIATESLGDLLNPESASAGSDLLADMES